MKLYNSKEFFVLGLFSLLIIGLGFTVADGSKKHTQRVSFESDAQKTQEISIVVQPRAEGDGDITTSEDDETKPEEPTAGSSADECERGEDCCLQYTWAGADLPVPTTPANNTCEWLRSKNGKSIACFDPLVYLTNEGQGNGGPNVQLLIDWAVNRPDWKIYCKRSKRSCLTYRFYSNSKGQPLINETRFCGSVSETNSEKGVLNGCYKEKTQGVVKEICVCSRDRCNGGESKYLSLVLITSAAFLTLIFSHWTSH